MRWLSCECTVCGFLGDFSTPGGGGRRVLVINLREAGLGGLPWNAGFNILGIPLPRAEAVSAMGAKGSKGSEGSVGRDVRIALGRGRSWGGREGPQVRMG